ncbi:MAG TPA: alkaline shock response membrane anchor protein AmaP [Pseudonocardia sp.]|jgi:hypothetical protein|nr:alkaline shock response membrane anchor protein AmaP [Pseudonocardia sp.]
MAATTRPARLNRVLLGLSGLILLAAGLFELAFALSPLGRQIAALSPKAPLLWPNVVAPWWLPWAGALLCLFVAVFSVRWLMAQAQRRPEKRVWRLPTEPGHREHHDTGRTLLDTDHAASAVAADIADYPDVAKATAFLTGPRVQPELLLIVHTETGADLDQLRQRIHGHALVRLRGALELTDLPTRLLLHLGGKSPAVRAR